MIFNAEHFALEPVGERAWAAVATGSHSSQGNAGIIALPEYTVVFDTFLTPQAAHELRSAARTLTGRDATLVVNSHWHFDHVGGNEVFADCEILGTPGTRAAIAEHGSGFVQQANDDSLARQISGARWQMQSESDRVLRADLEAEVTARQELFDVRHVLRVRAPTFTFADRRVLTSRRRAWVLEGAGHTMSDAVLYLPDEHVLFAGDLVTTQTHPNLVDGNLERWLECLGRLSGLGATRVVPGHGPVAGPEALDGMKEYLTRTRHLATATEKPSMPGEWTQWRARSNFDLNLAVAHRALVSSSGVS